MQVALGWRHDIEDRSFLRSGFQFVAPVDFEAPEEIDPRPAGLRVENQGAIGSCAGHGMTTSAEVVRWLLSGGDWEQLARWFSYIMGQRKARITGDNGCTITAVVQSAMEDGLPLEDFCPYPDRYRTDNITAEAIEDARRRVIRRHSKLTCYDDVYRWLASGQGAVVLGIPWTEELASNTSGIAEQSRGKTLGGHCVSGCGFVRKTDRRGRKYPIIANSHSQRYGQNGCIIAAPSLFDEWGQDGFSEMIGVTDLSDVNDGPKRTGFLAKNPW